MESGLEPRRRSVRHSGSLADQREQSVDEEEVSKVVDAHVTVDTVSVESECVDTDASIRNELK
jgi:hypothetical protein